MTSASTPTSRDGVASIIPRVRVLILDKDNEIAPEGVQQILEVLNTDIEGFNDIINGVFEEKQDKFDEFISPDEGLFERNM